QVEETRCGFARLVRQSDAAGRQAILAALDSSYPYVHYLALQAVMERRDQQAVPVLLQKLDAYTRAKDTVGFWWCCEALGRLRAVEAVPALARYAVAPNPPGTFGPEGMAAGYIAAKALAQIAGAAKQAEVVRLLTGDNVWLRAGALRGLAEARAPGAED